ncbi:DnaJ family domain-containing protein [Desulforamulus ruminis]|uniref:DnaJ family protein n=1 Tax=Desulforamulus ruminis (strain ATCC 23193 / DSM 2154 / NCIMB 8452 / DL) TaxID=696281 RepID=F6DL27_DESRL|nr:DnaJ family domain-containing protein [Desulforamulus ruminis]AEG58336.1 DnaJ family protein [Desulforamulus ruminis DSM 2154]
MGLTLTIEMLIKQAIERGELKNLPGEGKPIELKNLNPLETKEDRMINRLVAALMAASGQLPIEIIILKEIEGLKQRLEECKSDSEKQILQSKLAELNWKYEIQKEARLGFYNR